MSIEFSPRAERDLRRLGSGPHLKQIRNALQALAAGKPNVDVRPLRGRPPWHRLRAGEYRILYRLLDRDGASVIWVERVVSRGELERAVSRLD